MPTSYIEISIDAEPALIEKLIGILTQIGFEGFWEDGRTLRCYMNSVRWSDALLEETERLVQTVARASTSPAPKISASITEDQNWNAAWEKTIKPIRVTDSIVITPSWHDVPREPGQVVLVIDPKMSFGTGYHETTRLSLRLLENILKPSTRVLDIGTGTGVLAIAAAKLGAASVVGIDIDEWAYTNALENTERNGVAHLVTIHQHPVSSLPRDPFDLIVANIQLDVIAGLLDEITSRLGDKGTVILSGLLLADRAPLTALLTLNGFSIFAELGENEWIAIAARKKTMTVGVIDIGTNTVLLLIARMHPPAPLEVIVDMQRAPRLGKGVDAGRMLSPESIHRVVDVLAEYQTILTRQRVDRIVVAATSAVRDAANREAFAKTVLDETGYQLEVLTGREEAELTFRGAISGLSGKESMTVIDIGGGSTEITTGSSAGITERLSLDIGAVRLTERFLNHDPPTPEELSKTESFVRHQLANVKPQNRGSFLVGVAGTATSLAVLDLGLPVFERTAVANHVLTLPRLGELYLRLCGMRSDGIRNVSEVMRGREDIVTAGTLILISVMEHLGFSSLLVSERGIRYGLALRELQRAASKTGR